VGATQFFDASVSCRCLRYLLVLFCFVGYGLAGLVHVSLMGGHKLGMGKGLGFGCGKQSGGSDWVSGRRLCPLTILVLGLVYAILSLHQSINFKHNTKGPFSFLLLT
jgi:hypothetical protein